MREWDEGEERENVRERKRERARAWVRGVWVVDPSRQGPRKGLCVPISPAQILTRRKNQSYTRLGVLETRGVSGPFLARQAEALAAAPIPSPQLMWEKPAHHVGPWGESGG